MLILGMAALPAESRQGGIGYSGMFLFPAQGSLDVMPDIYPHSRTASDDIYNSLLILQGVEGFVDLGDHWQLGGLFMHGGVSRTLVTGDTTVMAGTSLNTGGLTVDYYIPVERNMGLSFGMEAGLNSYAVNYMIQNGSYSWDSVLDARNTDLTRNSLVSGYQFFTRVRVSAQLKLLSIVRMKFSAGLHYTGLKQSSWTLNELTPVSAPDDIPLLCPFVNMSLFMGF